MVLPLCPCGVPCMIRATSRAAVCAQHLESAARLSRQACRTLPLHGEAHAITAFGSACMLCMQAESEALLGGCETQGLPNLRFCNTSHTKTTLLYENVAKVPRPITSESRRLHKGSKPRGRRKNRLGGSWGTSGASWTFFGRPWESPNRHVVAPGRLFERLWSQNVVEVGLGGCLGTILIRFWCSRT